MENRVSKVDSTTRKTPFSNGSEAASWRERNCERCVKAAKLKEDGHWTKGRCQTELEIAMGFVGSDAFSKRTLERCSHAQCPDFADHYPMRKQKTTTDNDLTLF